jgi:hypothetical protein
MEAVLTAEIMLTRMRCGSVGNDLERRSCDPFLDAVPEFALVH